MNNFLDMVKHHSSHELFQFHELKMLEKYPSMWINLSEMGSQKTAYRYDNLILIREQIFEKVCSFFHLAEQLVDKQAGVYAIKKAKIPYKNPLEKKLNDAAMDRMTALFKQNLLLPLKNQICEINLVIPEVKLHFESYKNLCEVGEGKANQLAAQNLVKDMHTTRKKLNKLLFKAAVQMNQLKVKSKDLGEQGNSCGVSFSQNPASILFLGFFINRKGMLLNAKTLEEGIEIMENIKQIRSLCWSVEPIELLFINTIQVLRKMEKGMGMYLAKKFHFPSGFIVSDLSQDPEMKSFRSTSASCYDPETDLIDWKEVPGNISSLTTA